MEYIVCDSPAGIETGALLAMPFADEAVVVTNPEVSSVRDSDRILGMLASKTQRAIDGADPVKERLLITLQPVARGRRAKMPVSAGHRGHPAHPAGIGVVPESESVLKASNQGVPGHPPEGQRRVRGLQGRGTPVFGRRPRDALHAAGPADLLPTAVREGGRMNAWCRCRTLVAQRAARRAAR